MNRINSLDYLRGLMAFGIMMYHFLSWTFGNYESDSIIGILGTYGVSIFYVLSGLTLYSVYENKLDFSTLGNYFVKRLFRILPLLWLSTLLTIFLVSHIFELKSFLLNVTGLFGFFDHNNYIVTGAWSIGNELVFYALFPLVMVFNKKYMLVELAFVVTVILAIYFAFYRLDDATTLSQQWSTYIHPFNQAYLFFGGVLIGKLVHSYRNNALSLSLLALTVIALFVYRVEGDKINIVTNWERLVYSIISFALAISFLTSKFEFPKIIDRIFSQLGHISYSLYLMHAVVFWTVAKFMNRIDTPILFLLLTSSISILISWTIYNSYEKWFIRIGGKFVARYFPKREVNSERN